VKITSGTKVEIHYDLHDESGALFESTQSEGPVAYLHGNEEILPALEQALEGQSVGAQISLTLEADLAYGRHDPDGVVSVPKSEFPPDAEFRVGDWITVSVNPDEPHEHGDDCDHGPADAEHEMEMRVLEVRPSEVILDANHPLAGQRVTFHVRVLTVERG
jgi:FKBP-type peptidyl-prolyl cis-trans isomerase SlyD